MKKFLHILLFSSVALLFSGCVWGWGWLVPYNLQPSYWQFKKMCKLNELPNNEEKYNKILAYFDTDLESLDWEELNKNAWKIPEDNGNYKKGIFEYSALSREKEINFRLGIIAAFYSNQSPITRHNTNVVVIDGTWRTGRYVLGGNEGSGFSWDEEDLSCGDIAIKNKIPKGENNE